MSLTVMFITIFTILLCNRVPTNDNVLSDEKLERMTNMLCKIYDDDYKLYLSPLQRPIFKTKIPARVL